MARSDYVYVLLMPDQPPMTWTVKRELRTWLQHHPVIAASRAARLWRCRDGAPADAVSTMEIQDVLAGG